MTFCLGITVEQGLVGIADTRLALEVAIIQTYAERLTAMLRVRDPLSERVHLGKAGVAGLGLVGLMWGAVCGVGRGSPGSSRSFRSAMRCARSVLQRR